MRRRAVLIGSLVVAGSAGLFAALGGCGSTLIANLTKERTGNISIVFQNTTPYLASLTYGSYDAWDRAPGPVQYEQTTVAANAVTDAVNLTCARNFAVGTADLVDRMTATNSINDDDFDPDLFGAEVRFSSAPTGTDVAPLPNVGTADGIELLLGVHYSCGDRILLTFVEDADAPGGFRVDVEVILDEEQI